MRRVCRSFVISFLPRESDKTNVFRSLADVITALHFLLRFEYYCALVIQALHTHAPKYSSGFTVRVKLNGYRKITR